MNTSLRIRKIALLFITLLLILSARMAYWQAIVAKQVTANQNNRRYCLTSNNAARGRILDRNGVVLAYSAITNKGCGGYRRVYTDPSLAGLIGYYGGPNYGSMGIEKQFDDYLSGRMGTTALNNLLNQTLHRSPVGNDIYLTIDENIQKIVNNDFDTPVNIDNKFNFQTDRGSVIVSDPHTGEILAMVSRPGFDPNRLVSLLAKDDLSYFTQLQNDPENPLLERPIAQKYIPGSVYKTVTLMAGLESGSTTLNQPFDRQQALGPLVVNGEEIARNGDNIRGYTFHFPVTTEYGFAHSDNFIFAHIGLETRYEKWMEMNKKLYVGETIPFDLPVATSTVLKDGKPLQANELANNAFGQGYNSVTPLQMTLVDNAVANNGQLLRPIVVKKIVDTDNNPLQSSTAQPLSDPVSAQTATSVRQAMYGVIACGSGFAYPPMQNSPWGIIGKTGTAQIGDHVPAHAWMITQAPYSVKHPDQLPALTIVAMKENGGEGGSDIGPMITQMYADIFSKGYYTKVAQPDAPNRAQYCATTGLLQ